MPWRRASSRCRASHSAGSGLTPTAPMSTMRKGSRDVTFLTEVLRHRSAAAHLRRQVVDAADGAGEAGGLHAQRRRGAAQFDMSRRRSAASPATTVSDVSPARLGSIRHGAQQLIQRRVDPRPLGGVDGRELRRRIAGPTGVSVGAAGVICVAGSVRMPSASPTTTPTPAPRASRTMDGDDGEDAASSSPSSWDHVIRSRRAVRAAGAELWMDVRITAPLTRPSRRSARRPAR